MKNRIRTLFLAAIFSLTSAGVSHAMSTLIELSKEPVWPTSSTPDGKIVYNVTTVARAGSGMLEVVLSASGLPPGVTVTFSPSALRFTGNQLTSQTATMTVSCPTLIPTDCYPFTITGTALREGITITNLVTISLKALAVRLPTLILDEQTGNSLRLRGAGATGKTYQIETSPSLVKPVWSPLGSATADGNGRFTFFTSKVTGLPVRFYRATTTSEPVVTQ